MPASCLPRQWRWLNVMTVPKVCLYSLRLEELKAFLMTPKTLTFLELYGACLGCPTVTHPQASGLSGVSFPTAEAGG